VTKTSCDVAIVGGGPAGATLGALLAAEGRSVHLFEGDVFPRFHVGESLVPACNLILDRLGIRQCMECLGFPQKNGVQFFSPSGPGKPFYFSEVRDERMHHTWQVLRSRFDQLVVERAERSGARVHWERPVQSAIADGDAVVGLRVADGDGGGTEEVHARVVVDASGTSGILAQDRGQRQVLDGLRNTAVFAHYKGAIMSEGRDAGSTLIFRLEGKPWLWFIPLPHGVSVGVVAPKDEVAGRFGSGPEAILDAAIAECEPLRDRLEPATRITDALPVRDFSYRAQVDGGRGWALVGDALGFIDPMYSTGMFLSMYSAELGADAIHRALDGDERPDLHGFSRPYQSAFDQFLWLVRAFYEPSFHFGSLAREPEKRQGLVDLLTGVVDTPEAEKVTGAIRAFFGEADPHSDTTAAAGRDGAHQPAASGRRPSPGG